jgi:hypothetical protein
MTQFVVDVPSPVQQAPGTQAPLVPAARAAGCDCQTTDVRGVQIGGGACILNVAIDSECTASIAEDDGEDTTKKACDTPRQEPYTRTQWMLDLIPEAVRAPKQAAFCTVTYTIVNAAASNATITRFTVGAESFPLNIAPGGNDTISITMPQPAECTVRRIGIIEGQCPGGGLIRINVLRVCVLTGQLTF